MALKRIGQALFLALTISVLTGCLFPEEKKQQNQVPYEDQIKIVQNAIDQYQKDNNGLLPIKTRDQDTAIYQKYPIDFQKIVPQYTPEIPGNAFENGGIFQYVLYNVEEDPTVKIFDLRIAEKIRELTIRIQAQGYPPFKKQVVGNVYTLNYKALGYKEEPLVVSPYSNKNLPFVINGDGEIFVDYSVDLYEKLKNSELDVQQGDDIRNVLTEDSYFVPVYSLPYTIDENNEPIFLQR